MARLYKEQVRQEQLGTARILQSSWKGFKNETRYELNIRAGLILVIYPADSDR